MTNGYKIGQFVACNILTDTDGLAGNSPKSVPIQFTPPHYTQPRACMFYQSNMSK